MKIVRIKQHVIFTFLVLALLTFIGPLQQADAYLGDQPLGFDSEGYDVQQLQKDLNYLGYAAGTADGVFGWQTYNAVMDFQNRNGLTVDGVVGATTANIIIKQVSGGQATVSRGNLRLSRQDLYDLARVVNGEARGESFEGQVAVASVVLNRLLSGQFGNTVQDVIYQPGAFTAVQDGQFFLNPDSSSVDAVSAALSGWDPTDGALYYWNPITATSQWVWSRPIHTQIGQHVFAY